MDEDLPVDPDVDRELQPRIRTLVAIALGGALGAPARFAVASLAPVGSGRFPWTTFAINVSGAAALGAAVAILSRRYPDDHLARPLVATGFLGAFTTFSTLAVESDLLVSGHRGVMAAVYLVGSLGAGLAAVWLGLNVGRAVVARPEAQ